MSRADQYNVTVKLELGDDKLDMGTFDKMSGGEIDSEETKYRPGNMGPEITLGGYTTLGNVTVSRLFDQARDLPNIPDLMNKYVGKATATITKQSKNVSGVAVGTPLVYTGRLKMVTPPEHDSESSDAALLEMEFTIEKVA